MDLQKIKKDWEYYSKEIEENDIVDVDLHFSIAMSVGELLSKIEGLEKKLQDKS